MKHSRSFIRISPACKGAWALLFSVLVALACVSIPAYASQDVLTIVDDGAVYYGGYYDIEVEPIGFTAASYQWYNKWYSPIVRKTYVNKMEDGSFRHWWAHGVESKHVRWGTEGSGWDENGNADTIFEVLDIYCVITDTEGKEHYSDSYHIKVLSATSMEARLEKEPLASNFQPAPSGEGITKLSMKVGESQTFSFTSSAVPSWLAASDAVVKPNWQVLEEGVAAAHKYEGSSYTFAPTKAGHYLVYGNNDLYLANGDYFTYNKATAQYYLVEVTDDASPEPETTPIDTLATPVVVFGAYVDEKPADATAIPSADATYGGHFSATTISGAWQVDRGNGWEPLGSDAASTRFLYPYRYRYVLTVSPKAGYSLGTDVPMTVKVSQVYGPGSQTVTLQPSAESLLDAARYVVREIAPRQGAQKYGHASTPEEYVQEIIDKGKEDDTPKNGWVTDGSGHKLYYEDGVAAKGWKKIDGAWYWFDASGYMVVNRWIPSGSDWYYFGADGQMYKDRWLQVGSGWYYFGSDGIMYRNRWLGWSGGDWYYFGQDGLMYKSKWLQAGGDWYYFGADGVMARNQWIGSYHVGPDGKWDNQ